MFIKNIKTEGWEYAIYGMRLSHQSVDKSDSNFNSDSQQIGEKDLKLMKSLLKTDSERKFLRVINIYCIVKMPLYWYSEFDTYKVGTVRLSSSTIHNLMKRKVNVKDYVYNNYYIDLIKNNVKDVNMIIEKYKNNHIYEERKELLRICKQILGSGYLLESVLNFNYEVLRKIHKDRKTHKLAEWHYFLDMMIHSIPFYKDLIL